jgi:FMN phosphatase YigB (HAD superfamily)
MAQYERPDSHFDSNRPHPKRIFLFDVDGTLTAARKKITPEMHAYFTELRKKVTFTARDTS